MVRARFGLSKSNARGNTSSFSWPLESARMYSYHLFFLQIINQKSKYSASFLDTYLILLSSPFLTTRDTIIIVAMIIIIAVNIVVVVIIFVNNCIIKAIYYKKNFL